jgi:hypothetical protein
MVRTIGGAATTDGDAIAGDATAVGPALIPGEGADRTGKRSASLEVSVGGTPGGVGAASLPGTAPCIGRSLAGAQLAMPSAATNASARAPRWRPEDSIGLSLSTFDTKP